MQVAPAAVELVEAAELKWRRTCIIFSNFYSMYLSVRLNILHLVFTFNGYERQSSCPPRPKSLF